MFWLKKNGEILQQKVKGESEEGLTDRSLLNMKDIWDFINTVDVEDIKPVLKRQIEYNWTIAEEGIKGNYGANIGKVLLDMEGTNVRVRAKAMAAAGSDARMNGCELPVVINSGSGNQGITVSVPVIVYAKELNVGEEKMYRALALSNLGSDPSEDSYWPSLCILWRSQCRCRCRRWYRISLRWWF